MKYTLGALVVIGAVVALQRADRALPDGARGAATGAALLLLLALAELRRRERLTSNERPRPSSAPRPSLPSIHEIEVPYPKQRCAKCGDVIRKEREGDAAVLVADPERLRYYHRGCAPSRGR